MMTDKPKRQAPERASSWSKLSRQLRSPHAQIAAAAGASILALAIASRWVVPNAIGYLSQAFPPFLAVIFEAVHAKHPDSRISTTWYWIVAIGLATALVIGLHVV